MKAEGQKSSLPQGLRGIEDAFGAVVDPRLSVLDPIPESVRTSAALLATVLGQDIGLGALARLLRELDRRLGDRLLAVSASEWGELEKACRMGFLAEWPHKDSLAGWVLSVSDFLRSHGGPSNWKKEFGAPAEMVGAWARELPWMGSRSPSKVKGWRLARWLVRHELPGTGWNASDRTALVLPVVAVERPLRSLGWLPSGWSEWPIGRKQEWFDERLRRSAPHDPTSLWSPLETILSRGRSGPACQDHLRGCKTCPVRSDCPSPGRI